jgi:hypothetical protein
VRGDHLDALLSEGRVERVGVVGPVPDQALGTFAYKARREDLFYER